MKVEKGDQLSRVTDPPTPPHPTPPPPNPPVTENHTKHTAYAKTHTHTPAVLPRNDELQTRGRLTCSGNVPQLRRETEREVII